MEGYVRGRFISGRRPNGGRAKNNGTANFDPNITLVKYSINYAELISTMDKLETIIIIGLFGTRSRRPDSRWRIFTVHHSNFVTIIVLEQVHINLHLCVFDLRANRLL